MHGVRALAVAAVLAISACGLPAATSSSERDQDAQVLLEDLAAGRDDALVAKMSSENDPSQVRAQLPFIKTLVPEGPVPQGTTTGWRANAGTDGTTYALVRTYEYPDRTLNVETTFIKQADTWKVAGFNVSPTMKANASAPTAVNANPSETTPRSG